MIDPTSAWEELLGMPSAQVPRFQMIAASSSEKIIAYPAVLPAWRINSTGRSVTML